MSVENATNTFMVNVTKTNQNIKEILLILVMSK